MKLALLLSVLLFSFGVFAAPVCKVSLAYSARQGALYQSGNGWLQIYDLVLTNTGDCGVNSILLDISTSNFTDIWNLTPLSGHYNLTSFGSVIFEGNSVNAGFVGVFATQSAATSATVSLFSTFCAACLSTTSSSASSTTASTSASTTASSSTSAVSTTSSTTGTSPSPCHASATVTARANNSWQSGTGISQLYDLVVINDGNCGANTINLQLNLPNGAQITSSWNLNVISGLQYSLTSYGDVLPIGNSVNAGFVVLFANTQQVPTGISASILTSNCNACSATTSGSSTTSSSTSGSASTSTSGSVASTTSTSGSSSTSTTGTPSSCNLVATLTARVGGSFPSVSYLNGISQIFDFSITNLGACRATSISLTINTAPWIIPNYEPSISSWWNLDTLAGASRFSVLNYGGALYQGQVVTGGFIMTFANTPTLPSPLGISITLEDVSQCSC